MPREKIKVYQYNASGNFVNSFNSFQEIRDLYYNGNKYPLFRNNNEYHILPDNTMIVKSRVGRDLILLNFELNNNVYTKIRKSKFSNFEVEALSLTGDKLAEFKNINIASIISKIPKSTIIRQCLKEVYHMPKNENRIIFRFKIVKDEH